MEKMDGSLGVLYDGDDFHRSIATRGSFHSEQAQWATKFIRQFECDVRFYPSKDKTYLFEIIYPANRIVVDYGDYTGLVLLDVIDTKTGFSDTDEFDNCAWPDKVGRQAIPGFDSGLVVDIPQGAEGFVFLWPARNFRTKMKSAEYVEIHRMISRLSEKTVWEALVAGKTRDQIKVGLPEEFHAWVDGVIDNIQADATRILENVTVKWINLETKGLTNSRKEFALAVKDHPLRKYLFLMLDNKPVYEVALRDSKPVKETNLTRED
jgi:RNA ligase